MEFPHPDHSGAQKDNSAASGPFPKFTGHSSPATCADLHAPILPSVSAPAKPSEWVELAHIIRPHGRHGEVVADILTDFPERFRVRRELWLISSSPVSGVPREFTLENFWFLRSRVVLKLAGIDSISAAEGIRGCSVAIPPAERAPLDSGSWYASDLIGCELIDLNRSAVVGEIVDIDRGSSSTDLLVVRREGAHSRGGELLIPFVRDYLVRVDPAERHVEMRLPDGLVDINAPLTAEEKGRTSGG
jgi:16S rRNA processing protein RimM